MTKNEFQLLYSIKKNGVRSYRKMHESTGLSLGLISKLMASFAAAGYIDDTGITEPGLKALSPYKVSNAVIMAAGMSSRFVPLSLEKPKGLLEVKGEILIERQIEQIKAAGIDDVIVILGYKKEAFFYLEDKYDNVRIIINPEYNTKNNTHTLYVAREYIGNSFICSSDDYFVENPFEDYVYQSYYAAQHVEEKTSEWYMYPDAKGNISKVVKGGTVGDIMLGHVYWDNAFSEAMLAFLEDSHVTGKYDQDLWEQILLENVKKLPPMQIRVFPDGDIFEFDSLDELREFDDRYVNDTHSSIMHNICRVMDCSEKDILGLKIIKNGLTNTSFVFELNGNKYVYRHTGEGSSELISRADEKISLEQAESAGIDPTFIYMDDEGWKISHFIENARTPDYDSREDSSRVISVLKKLHDNKLHASRDFDPWAETCKLEEMLAKRGSAIADSDYSRIKADIRACYERFADAGAEKYLCHCDTYAGNWLLTEDGKTILIDWEYAGNADPACDTGSYIMDSMWDVEEAEAFIREYCGADCTQDMIDHHIAFTAIMAFHWYVWALYREACGTVMGESLYKWRVMARRYSKYIISKYN